MNCEKFLGLHELYLDTLNGRGSLADDLFKECELHLGQCHKCQLTLAQDEYLIESIASLPVVEAPKIQLPTSIQRSIWWISFVAAACVAIFVTMVLVTQFETPKWIVAKPGSLEFQERENWRIGHKNIALDKQNLRTTNNPSVVSLGDSIVLRIEPNSYFSIENNSKVKLDSGIMTAWIKPGTKFEIKTSLGRVAAKGTVFTVNVQNQKELKMNNGIKTVVVAATASVFVSMGTVAVYSSLGKTDVGSGETALLDNDHEPQAVQIVTALDDVQKELVRMRSSMKDLEGRSLVLERRLSAGKDASKDSPVSQDRETIRKEAGEIFDVLEGSGWGAYQHPKMLSLVEKVRALGDEGIDLVEKQLTNETPQRRFVAAAVAEKLKDPALIDNLEDCATDDKDFMVKRMAAHALAFMEHEDAGDALLRIFEDETRDTGVRLNAWYGLASLGRPEAIGAFRKLVNEAGGDITADMVVATALKISNPNLMPEFMWAFGHASVTTPIKILILRTLGADESGTFDSFLEGIANNSQLSQAITDAAKEVLGQ